MGNDMDAILRSMGIKDQFDTRAKEAIDKAKSEADDQSVFESKDKFVEHYSNELFGSSSNNEIEMNEGFFKKINLEDEEDIQNFYSAFDGRDEKEPDQKLSREEAGLLLGAAYDAAAEKPQLYNTVELQAWGTKDDDCLSRIINKHVDGIKLYSDDYNTYLSEMCKLNDIEDPNVVQTGKQIKMPEIKADAEGNFIRDEDGNIQFYSEEELSDMKGLTEEDADGNKIYTKNFDDGTSQKTIKDPEGNILRNEFYSAEGKITQSTEDGKDANGIKTTTVISYDENEKQSKKTVNTYDETGYVKSREEFDADDRLTQKAQYNKEGAIIGGYKCEYGENGEEIYINILTGEKIDADG